MKADLICEFEFDKYGSVNELVKTIEATLGSNIRRITVVFHDSEDKPFMTETPIGSTEQS